MHPTDMLTVLSEYGPAWASWRVFYQVLSRTGRMQTLFRPPGSVTALLASAMDVPAAQLRGRLAEAWNHRRGRFFLADDVSVYRGIIGAPEDAMIHAGEILRGRLLFFRRWEHQMGHPPDWHQAAGEHARWPP